MAVSEWQAVAELTSERGVEKRFGLLALRITRARLEGKPLPATWLLDRRMFRSAVRTLPPGHDSIAIAAEKSHRTRDLKAARAARRLAAAAQDVPLPEFPEGTRLVVWASPTTKPRGLMTRDFAWALDVSSEPSEVRTRLGWLWASAYFEEALRAQRDLGLKRFGVALGLTAIRPDEEEAWAAMLDELLGPAELVESPAAPFGATAHGPESPLGRSLSRHAAAAWAPVIEEVGGRWPIDGLRTQLGRVVLTAESTSVLLRRLGPRQRAIAAALFQSSSPTPTGGPAGAFGWGRWAASALREAAGQSGLSARVNRTEAMVRELTESLRELDLSLLPDDGLKRTLERLLVALEEAAGIEAATSWSAASLEECLVALQPQSKLCFDAGLEALPWFRFLAAWEETLSVVRSDRAASRAILDGEDMSEGPALRALTGHQRRWSDDVRASFDPGRAAPWDELGNMVRLARPGMGSPIDLSERARAARVDADRLLAAGAAGSARIVEMTFAVVRASALDAVVLRERARFARLRLITQMRRVALDLGRRLTRLEPELPEGAAFCCTVSELALAADLRESALGDRVWWRTLSARRDEWMQSISSDRGPRQSSGIALSMGVAEGPAASKDAARRGDVVISEALHEELIPLLPYVAGIVTRRGQPTDTVAVMARSLGVPVVVCSGSWAEVATARGIVRMESGADGRARVDVAD